MGCSTTFQNSQLEMADKKAHTKQLVVATMQEEKLTSDKLDIAGLSESSYHAIPTIFSS